MGALRGIVERRSDVRVGPSRGKGKVPRPFRRFGDDLREPPMHLVALVVAQLAEQLAGDEGLREPDGILADVENAGCPCRREP